MTREETQKLLLTISSIYPNFKPEDKTLAVDSWQWALEEYPAPAVKAALQIYVKTNNTGFAPSVSQLIGSMYSVQENNELSEGEAWHLVKRAIADSGYHAQERYDELPPLIQRAIGGPEMLHVWGQTDSNEVNTVIMSNFQRTYRALLSKQEFSNKIPESILDIVKLIDSNDSKRIGVNNDV